MMAPLITDVLNFLAKAKHNLSRGMEYLKTFNEVTQIKIEVTQIKILLQTFAKNILVKQFTKCFEKNTNFLEKSNV